MCRGARCMRSGRQNGKNALFLCVLCKIGIVPTEIFPHSCLRGNAGVTNWRGSPHCRVVNLVRSGRKQPQLITASAGGKARLLFARPLEGAMNKLLFLVLLLSGNVWAVDGMSVEAGNGDATNTARVGAVWNFDHPWFTEGNWQVAGFWEAMAGQWQGHSGYGNNQTVTDIGLTPVFRFEQKKSGAFS